MFLNSGGWLGNSSGGSTGGDITIVGSTNSIVDSLAQMNSIPSPKNGDMCYIINDKALYMYNNSSWQVIPTVESDWSGIQNKPQSTITQIDEAVLKAHEHTFEEEVLNKLTQDENGNLLFDEKEISGSPKWENFSL